LLLRCCWLLVVGCWLLPAANRLLLITHGPGVAVSLGGCHRKQPVHRIIAKYLPEILLPTHVVVVEHAATATRIGLDHRAARFVQAWKQWRIAVVAERNLFQRRGIQQHKAQMHEAEWQERKAVCEAHQHGDDDLNLGQRQALCPSMHQRQRNTVTSHHNSTQLNSTQLNSRPIADIYLERNDGKLGRYHEGTDF
jgi:hypothetical protein